MRYFEKRSAPDHAWTLTCYAAAVVITFLGTAVMLKLFGGQPVKAFLALVSGAVGSERAIYGTLAQATPIFLMGIGTAVALRANLWNIGQEGQVIAGAIAGYWASLALTGTPLPVSIPVVVLASMAGGGLVAAISAILRTRFDISEILSTVMISYLIYYLLLDLLDGGPWMERGISPVAAAGPVARMAGPGRRGGRARSTSASSWALSSPSWYR